jgi:hypothetical protein
MATRTEVATPPAGAERPDGEYAFVAGLYVAALLAPAVVLALSRVVTGAAALYVGLLVAVTGVTVVAGWAASRTPGLAVTLGRHDAVWLLVVLPFGWSAGTFGAAAVGIEPPAIAFPLAVVGTAGGMFLGLMLVAMSRTRHADAALDGTTELAAWEARWPRRWRRVAGGVAVVAFTTSTLGVLAAVLFETEWGWELYYLLFVAVPLANVLNPRTFRVTDAGLVVEHPLQRQFRPGSAFTGYDLTEEAIVIRPAAWWRPAHRCDRADVEDVDAAVAALDRGFPGRE